MTTKAKLLNEFAVLYHTHWSHWNEYLFEKGEFNPDGSLVIPKELVDKMSNLSGLDYNHLPSKIQVARKCVANDYMNTINHVFTFGSKH